MRQGLRSSSLKRKVDEVVGSDDGGSRSRVIPDLNVVEDCDVVLSEERGGMCCEVSKSGEESNVLSEAIARREGEVNGVEVENECGRSGLQSVECRWNNAGGRKEGERGVEERVGNVGGSLMACCEVLGIDTVIGEREDVKETDMGSVTEIVAKVSCHPSVLETPGIDDVHDVTGSPRCMDVDSDYKIEKREENVDCDPASGQPNSSVLVESFEKMGGVEAFECEFNEVGKSPNPKTEDFQDRVQVRGRVLRSRIVPASGFGEDSASERKKERKNTREKPATTVKDECPNSVVDSERMCKHRRPKESIGQSEKVRVQIKEVSVVSKAEDEDANHKSVDGSRKKGKRGRPRKCVEDPVEEVVLIGKAQVESEVQDRNLSSKSLTTSIKTGRRGRPKKLLNHPAEVGIQMNKNQVVSDVDDEDLTDRSARTSKKKGKRGRPKKLFDCKVEEVVGSEVEQEEGGNICSSSAGKSQQQRKRGRPKISTDFQEEEVVLMKKVPFGEVDDEIDDKDVLTKSVRNEQKERRRGRPRKQEGNIAVKSISCDKGNVMDERKPKVSLVTSPVRKNRHHIHSNRIPEIPDGVPSKKRVLSDKKVKFRESGRMGVNSLSKGEETPLPDSNVSVKRKRVETIGSLSAEKNSIRKRIVDLLLGAGWRIEYRPRQGREYNDAVYVNPDGKTHWSVTKAYYTLKQEVEEGKVRCGSGKSNFCFIPLPEEVLGKLFRVVSKTRSDKNKKKKHKNDSGDSSDEDQGARGKGGAKHRHSSAKRKPAVRKGVQSKRRCALLVRHSNKGLNSEGDGIKAYSGKHSVLAWMIDSGTIPLDGKVQCMNLQKKVLEGGVRRDGIHCSCCKEVISVAEFEKHAGSTLCEPYENLYLENGRSLLQCQLDSWNKQEEMGRSGYHNVPVEGDDPNDDTCGICGDGGDLVCCDACPSTFHHDCLEIEEVPLGEWQCVYCSCKFCGGANETASESQDDCDAALFSLVTCNLCHKKYHRSCINEVDVDYVESGQQTFCGNNCEQIFERLRNLVGAKHDLEDGFSWTLLQRSDVTDAVTLPSQKVLSNSKLAVALSVMDECFLPIIDPRSGINLIRHIVYNCGSNFNRLNFSNFFTVILERGDEVICAASIRIHGIRLAEMPFIGTRNVYRRKGMCRRLLNAIELALSSLDIEKLVIPAIPELLDTWTSVFGFMPLEDSVKEQMRSMSMLVFPHTGMLQKLVLKQQVVSKTAALTEDDVKFCESGNEHLDGGADRSEVDNGCANGTFDLNCVAPGLPESSSDDEHLGHPVSTAGNCEDDVKTGMNLGGLAHANKIEGRSTPEETDDNQAGTCAFVVSSSERKTLQPDLNLMAENVFGDNGNLNILYDKKSQTRCSETVNLNELAKSTMDSNDQTGANGLLLFEDASKFNKFTKSECVFDRTNSNGASALGEAGENVASMILGNDNNAEVTNCKDGRIFPSSETVQSSSLMGCQESEVGCSDVCMSDAYNLRTVALSVCSDDASTNTKVVSNFEIHGAKENLAFDGTVIDSPNNVSLSIGAQLPSKSTDYSSVSQITSETSCTMSSVTGDTGIPCHFNGNGISKVGSES